MEDYTLDNGDKDLLSYVFDETDKKLLERKQYLKKAIDIIFEIDGKEEQGRQKANVIIEAILRKLQYILLRM